MSSLFSMGIGTFLGVLLAGMALLALDGMSAQVVPGAVLFSMLSGVVPAALCSAGLAIGRYLGLPRVSNKQAFLGGLLIALIIECGRHLPLLFSQPILSLGPFREVAYFVGGLCTPRLIHRRIAFRMEDQAPRPASTLSQRIALIELIVFVCPLAALWPFAVFVLFAEWFDSAPHLAVAIPSLAISGAALIALLSVLGTYISKGRNGLMSVSKAQWGACAAGGLLVVVATALMLFDQSAFLPLERLEIGIFGLPAIVPLSHMILERRQAAFQ